MKKTMNLILLIACASVGRTALSEELKLTCYPVSKFDKPNEFFAEVLVTVENNVIMFTDQVTIHFKSQEDAELGKFEKSDKLSSAWDPKDGPSFGFAKKVVLPYFNSTITYEEVAYFLFDSPTSVDSAFLSYHMNLPGAEQAYIAPQFIREEVQCRAE